jgi:hypothetical protein
LNELKPLKIFHYTLEQLLAKNSKENRDLSRSLYELFFFADKLACLVGNEAEFRANMKSKEEILQNVQIVAKFCKIIENSISKSTNDESKLPKTSSILNESPLLKDARQKLKSATIKTIEDLENYNVDDNDDDNNDDDTIDDDSFKSENSDEEQESDDSVINNYSSNYTKLENDVVTSNDDKENSNTNANSKLNIDKPKQLQLKDK